MCFLTATLNDSKTPLGGAKNFEKKIGMLGGEVEIDGLFWDWKQDIKNHLSKLKVRRNIWYFENSLATVITRV